ncbi:ABC transporter permease (plasmid) [Tistrella bauzanensis]|uniref:ABC transporter permease n=1 Tax=Tistrella arctica TaxID=3133430 RepID=A0ABU9YL30_9PROT
MTGFVVSRLLRAVLTLLLIVSLAFVVLRASGDPALLILSVDAPAEAIEAFRKAWGLDQPLWLQYLHYLRAVATGDLGQSMLDGRPAVDVVFERIPATLMITVPALVMKLAIGLPAGIHAALHRDAAGDRVTMAAAMIGHAMPSFVFALLLVLVFSVELGWLPSAGSGAGSGDWRHAVMPVITLGIAGAAAVARFSRSAMIEVLGRPYIRTASAKGLVWRRVVRDHALPNAAIPTVTLLGFLLGGLIAGAVVVETVFAWPGIGRLMVTAVANRDLAVVQTILLLAGATMVAANLAIDLAYGWLDPRIRRAGGAGSLIEDPS